MNKKEFLKHLEEKLNVLDEKEIKDILEEYKSHIEEKVKDGNKEKEVIESFGDIDELVEEILKAYKINAKKVNKGKTASQYFNVLVDEMALFFKKVIKVFEGKKGDDFARIICKFILILILILILRVPFDIIKNLGVEIFSEFPWFLGRVISYIWKFIIELSYFVISILTIYVSIKNLILDEEVVIDKEEIVKKAEEFEEVIDSKKSNRGERVKMNTSDSRIVLTPLSILLRVFIVIMTIPAFFMLFGLIVFLGIMIASLFEGVYIVSMFFIIIGLIMMTSSILGIIYKFIFGKGGRN